MEPSTQRELTTPTAEDLVEFEHHEIVNGGLVRKASPAWGHAELHAILVAQLSSQASWRGGHWRFVIEPIVELTPKQVYLPDIAGWRTETLPETPELGQVKITVPPDWVCELLSPSTARHDLTIKRANYCAAGVGYYWVIYPRDQILTVLRNNGQEFEIAETVSVEDANMALEPFTECVLDLGALFRRHT